MPTIAVVSWIFALTSYALDISGAALIGAVALAVLASVAVAMRNVREGVLLLPYPALLGPILPFQVPVLGMLTSADLYLAVLVSSFLILDRKVVEPILLGKGKVFLIAATLAVLFSSLFSEDLGSSSIALVNLAQLLIVYLVTLNVFRSAADTRELLLTWSLVATLCSLLTLIRYYQGEPLLLPSDGFAELQSRDEYLLSNYFFRATFFYAGLFFVLAVAIVTSVSEVASERNARPIFRGFLILSIVINALTLILMNTKSAIYSTVVVVSMLLGVRLISVKRLTIRATGSIALPFIALGVTTTLLLGTVESEQLRPLVDRFASTESLDQRIDIASNAVAELLSDQKLMLLGLGPDVIIRSPTTPQASRILRDPLTGYSEGALDSTFLTVLVELGLVSFLALAAFVICTLRLLLKIRKALPEDIYQALAGGIAVLLLTATTQYMGWSKTSWLFVQLLAVVHSMSTRRSSWPGSSVINPRA